MQEKPLYLQVKRIPLIFLFILLSGVAINLWIAISSVGETTILNVSIHDLKEKTIKDVTMGENSFSTGYEGKLYWKITTWKEAFLVSLGDRDNPINFYDLFYFLVVDLILFVMVFRVNEETVFSDQISTGLKLVAFSVIGYPAILLLGNHIAEWSIEELTQGKFTAQYRPLGVVKYLYLSYLILFFIPLLKKAINLQKEQDLTI